MRNPFQDASRRVVVGATVAVLLIVAVGVALATRSDRPPVSGDVVAESSAPAGVSSSPGADESSEGEPTPNEPSSGAPTASGTSSESESASASASGSAAPSVSASSSPGAAAPTASPVGTGAQIRPEFFGLHIHSPLTAWPTVPFGSTRLWDSGVNWRQMQPSRGKWNFATLDAQVAQANTAGKDVIMVLGVTPPWAASRPGEKGNYGDGAASEPKNLADWTTYVRTLAERYRGKITKWELWNEPNAVLFWSAPAATMVPFAKAAYEILKATDSRNLVLSPGIVVRTLNSPLWLDQYLAAGGGRYADVIAAHFYVKTGERPEHLRPSMERIQAIMVARGVADKPLWNTESSYGQVRQPTEIFNEPLASAYVARSLALFAGHGIARVYWYAWDDHGFTGLYLSRKSNQPTEAGRVFGLMSSWLTGARPSTCERLGSGKAEGAFACSFSRGDERFQIVWHPGTTVQYDVPPGVRTVRRLNGASQAHTGATVAVSPIPILMTTASP